MNMVEREYLTIYIYTGTRLKQKIREPHEPQGRLTLIPE